MPYNKKSELPSSVKDNLPSGAQSVWMRAFNAAYSSCRRDKGSDCDKIGSIAGWVAVRNGWKKDKDGKWVKKTKK